MKILMAVLLMLSACRVMLWAIGGGEIAFDIDAITIAGLAITVLTYDRRFNS